MNAISGAVPINNNVNLKFNINRYINNDVFNIEDINKIDQAIFDLELTDDPIILSAESDSLHIWVITIMDILNKYGFNEVQIRTIEK